MKIRKAVIPAAGLGTRVLPASKSIPKEMLPIVDKPAIQYIVEEAAASGIEDILIITSRGKDAIADHFDRSPLLEQALEKSGKADILESVVHPAQLANITFLRQQEIKGLGHAVWCAKSFIGDEPFAVLYGDDVIVSDGIPVMRQLIDAFDEFGLPTLGIKEVTPEQILKYSSMKVELIRDNLYRVDDMIEKPKPSEILSLFSILGRVVLTPDVFDILETLPPGALGEIQLTDAIKILAHGAGTVGVDFVGTRYDMGNKLG
ncbi:MAG: UTP--glucose-1-phosphate uridylyltransferase, partial [Oscillospiraceae bacterium]